MHNGIPTILQPTKTTGKSSLWQRSMFRQYSKDLWGKQVHNYRDTEIYEIEKDCMEICSTGSNTFWWTVGTPHWDEQTTIFQYRRTIPGRPILICQVEALLNSRPLTLVSCDIRELESLTPGHFLTGTTTGLPSDTTISRNNRGTGKLWNNVNSIMNELWRRFLKQYLPTLRQRWKWHSKKDGIEVGDMVWILENNTPRGIWPVGRVQKVNKCKYNVVRSYLVKIQEGIL